MGRIPEDGLISRRMTISLALTATVLTFAACGRAGATSATTSLPPQSTPSTSSTTERAVAVSVDTAATPKSWVPVPYGEAQISVPQSWLIGLYAECNPTSQGFHSTTQGMIYVSGLYQADCQDFIENRALVANTASIGPEVGKSHSLRHSIVNGITVYWTSPDDSGFVVPSLHVEVSATGPLAQSSSSYAYTVATVRRARRGAAASNPELMAPDDFRSNERGGAERLAGSVDRSVRVGLLRSLHIAYFSPDRRVRDGCSPRIVRVSRGGNPE
jgi:hypothetical protein